MYGISTLWGEVGVEGEGVVLEQEGAARRLEEDVVAGVTKGELLAGFLGEIVAAVFSFPKPMGEAEVVEQRAVHAERVLARAADFPFRDEGPVVLAGAVVEQALESGADGGFVRDAEVVELAQGGVIILDRLVRGLQFQPLHGCVLHQRRGGRQWWFGLKSEGRAQRERHLPLTPALPFDAENSAPRETTPRTFIVTNSRRRSWR